jgi:hypothetical protein
VPAPTREWYDAVVVPAPDRTPQRVVAGSRVAWYDLGLYASDGIELAVTAATKHPDNPVLALGDAHEWDALQARPWQSRTVLFDPDDGLFKCWYDGTDLSTERWWATGYAESEDGSRWHKPQLGLHAYNGSTANNICLFGWGPVIRDPDEPDPHKRFKMVVSTKRFQCSVPGASREPAIRLAYSPDGKSWLEGEELVLPEWQGQRPDVVALVHDREDASAERRFKLVWQGKVAAAKAGPSPVRTKHLTWAPTIEALGTAGSHLLLSPNDGAEHDIHFAMLAPTPSACFVGYEYGVYVPDGTGVHGRYVSDVRLAASADLPHFARVRPDQALLVRGPRGAWDDGFLVISDKPVNVGDTTYLYYAGCGEDWTSWMGANRRPEFRWESTGTVRASRMGVATLPREGYTHLRTVDSLTPGWLETPVSRVAGRLTLTATVAATQQGRSWIEVEVLPEVGQAPLPGFSRQELRPLAADGVGQQVSWRGAAFQELEHRSIRLRWRIYGAARLHGFGFTDVKR